MATLTWQRHICTSAAVGDRGPARKNGILNLSGGERDHDVSILITVGGGGLYCGVEPRLKVSMMFMRPPRAIRRQSEREFRAECRASSSYSTTAQDNPDGRSLSLI